MPFIIPCLCSGSAAPFGAFGVADNRGDNYTLTTTKYSYGTDAVANGTNLANARVSRGAARYTAYGIFIGGNAQASVGTTNTEKYSLPGEAVSAGTAMINPVPNNQNDQSMEASDQNNGYGIFYNGSFNTQNILQKYIFASDVSGLSTSIAQEGWNSACGNGTISIIAGGLFGATATNTTQKFNYSNESSTGSTNLSGKRWKHCSRSDNITALFMSGYNADSGVPANETKSVDKMNLSSFAITSGTALSNSQLAGMAMGNSTFALMVGGTGTGLPAQTTQKYTFGTDATSTGTNLQSASTSAAAF